MKTTMLVALAIAAIQLTGCARWQQIEKPQIGSRGGTGREMPPTQQGIEVPVSRKEIVGRRDPATLLAADGTSCAVTEKRYREASVGELVWCAWRRD